MSRPETNPPLRISRREALRHVTALLGGTALVGGHALLAACAARQGEPARVEDLSQGLFSWNEAAWLDEVADTILPETDTPGARAARVGPFIALMVTDAYSPEQQAVFREGMQTLETACTEQHGTGFMTASPEQRLALLEHFDAEQKAYMDSKQEDDPAHWFRMVKELTLLGYFTSEIGYTQAMRYVETPGRYDPCAPLEPGGKTWADHA